MSSQVSSSPSTTTVSSTPRSEGEIPQSANVKSFAFTELIFSWLLLLLPPVAPAPCCRVRHSHRRPAGHAFKYAVRYVLVDLDHLVVVVNFPHLR
ncbi:hypothetical protein TRIUR3_14389 [Triticum urartu]|uniref:Uncharacterized protein n=1 Tax=Triticum urartu TaxID=4572 RepID=M7ZQX9_TRIUA|nr:hypothetical protein TRIUR3_14389 [Triticum urartu]